MIRTALCTALLALVTLSTRAQEVRRPAAGNRSVGTAGKVAVPVGPMLAGEEKLSAQERAERTFLMPARKKMPSVQPAPPQPDPTGAVAIGPPTVEEAAEEAAKTEAARPASPHRRSSYHRSSRRHSSSARSHRSSRKKSSASRSSGSKKKASAKKSSSKKKSSSSRRRRR